MTRVGDKAPGLHLAISLALACAAACTSAKDDTAQLCSPLDTLTWYADGDGDGYGDAGSSTEDCQQPEGYVADSSDCDDDDAAVHPGATEECDGADNDCDGLVDDDDEQVEGQSRYYADSDGDGYGDADSWVESCQRPDGYLDDSSDCDDTDPATYPGAPVTECTDGDMNCDGIADDYDNDGDGVDNCDDCDDDDPAVHPGADEVCDGADNDCDGLVDDDDDDLAGAGTWYADTDGDGYGDALAIVHACEQPDGYLDDSSDCDDGDPEVHPEAFDACADGVDMDCDGVDECAVSGDYSVGPADWSASFTGATDLVAAGSGDLDGDGLADFMVGAPGSGPGAAGSASIYFGAEGGPSEAEAVTLVGGGDGAELGASLASAGDPDGDGNPDIILGSPGLDSGQGAAYLFLGPITPAMELALEDADATVEGDSSHIDVGEPVAGLGDVDGDGSPDLGMGVTIEFEGDTYPKVYIFTDIIHDTSFTGKQHFSLSGFTDEYPLALGGADLDGDGLSEVMVGDAGYEANSGVVYLYTDLSTDSDYDLLIVGESSGDELGAAVEAAGDLDGDGLADLLVGAPGAEGGRGLLGVFTGLEPGGGEVSVLDMGDAQARVTGPAGGGLGGSAVRMGDMNGDGEPDLLVGAADADSAYLFLGPVSGSLDSGDAYATLRGAPGSLLGAWVAGPGDTDGDSFDEMLLCAPGSGSVYLLQGGP